MRRTFPPPPDLITVAMVVKLRPCREYTLDRLKQIFGDGLTAIAFAGLDSIPITDRLWLLLRPAIVGEEACHVLACTFADRALGQIAQPDPRSVAGIAAMRGWLAGTVSDDELRRAAAAAAAHAAAAAVAVTAADAYAAADAAAAAVAAADAAAAAATYVAAYAERRQQLADVVAYLQHTA